MAMTPEELLLSEVDYAANLRWCKTLHSIGDPSVFCRRERGHSGDVHATRSGPRLLSWRQQLDLAPSNTDNPRFN
ncbi:MAG: hypothetical protein NVSMB39_0250 [Candidatus Saccharimonadales bacterium]